MASYYDSLRMLKVDLQDLVSQNPGKRIAIAPLVVKYGVRFGFGRRTLENVLREFQADNRILLYKDEFEVL